MPILNHFTCPHSQQMIGVMGYLQPISVTHPFGAQLMREQGHGWLADVIWLTDLTQPNAFALGLTSVTLHCDRTAHRYHVLDESTCVPYSEARARSRAYFPVEDLKALERAPGAEPRHWWISTVAVPVVYDPIPKEGEQ